MSQLDDLGDFEVVSDQVDLPRGAFARGHRLNIRWRGRPIGALSQGPFRAYLFPLYTPGGYPITTESPLDHPHHNSLWMAMDRVRCALPFAQDEVEEAVYNFYVNETFQGRAPGRIEVSQTTWRVPAPGRLQIDQEVAWRGPCEWGAAQGRVVLVETRRWEIAPGEHTHIIDVHSRLSATTWDVVLGPTRHAYFGLRLADALRVTAGGWLFDANGNRGGANIAGTTSAWVAAGGDVGAGQQAAVMLFPYPNAAGHPWYVTDWGTLTINPFVDQSVSLPVGSSHELAMRVVVHNGPLTPEEGAAHYTQFLASIDG